MSRRVVVMAALKQEAAPLARALSGIGEDQLRLVLSGVGLARAEAAARNHLQGASLLISTGCCGGLVPGASNGLLVIPRKVLFYDGQEASEGRELPAPDEQWVNLAANLAEQRGLHCSDRPLASVREALTSPSSKAACHQQCGAVAVDMESAALARVAGELGVPHLVVRHVLDSVAEPLPERQVADDKGRIRPLKLARALTQPREFLGRAQMALRLKANASAVAPLIQLLVQEAL